MAIIRSEGSTREEAGEGGETALVPKSLLAGKTVKPGDKIILKVVRLYDDEVEVEYASSGADEGEETEGPMSAEREIDMMAQENAGGRGMMARGNSGNQGMMSYGS